MPPDDPRAWRRRSSRCSPTSSAARARRERAPHRPGALRLGRHRPSARSRSTSECSRSSRRRRSPHEAASRPTRGPAWWPCSHSSCCVAVLLWWRGPEWDAVADAFRLVEIALGRGRGRLQPALRRHARVRLADGHPQALPQPHAEVLAHLLRLLRSACSRTPCCPARIGELARVARADAEDAGREGARPTLLGTVFAHRVFDLVPVADAHRLRPADGEDPALGDHEPLDRRRRRRRSVRVRDRSARGSTASHSLDELGPVRRAARDGAAWARRDAHAAGRARSRSSSSASAGSASSLRSGRRCGPSTSTSRCRPPRSCSCS